MREYKSYIFLFLVTIFIVSSCDRRPLEKKDSIHQLQEKISSVITQVTPSIVTVFSKQNDNKSAPSIFRYDLSENESVGSGFIIKRDAKYFYIITNTHVIEKAKNIAVRFYNDLELKAEVVGSDTKTDISIIRVPITPSISNLKPLKFAPEEKIKVGYFVIAAGSPYNLGYTYTFGIISALNRDLGISSYEDYIQTDAAINPGDSGGPLINIDGEVVGMNVAIIQSGEGLGFAIPASTIKDISEDIIKYGKVRRGWIGIMIEDIPENLKESKNLSGGAIIIKIQKNSPAIEYGLKEGDIIYAVDDIPIKNAKQLKKMMLKFKPNQDIKFDIIRDNIKISIILKAGEKDL